MLGVPVGVSAQVPWPIGLAFERGSTGVLPVAIPAALRSVTLSGNLIGGNSGILLSGFFGISSGNGSCKIQRGDS